MTTKKPTLEERAFAAFKKIYPSLYIGYIPSRRACTLQSALWRCFQNGYLAATADAAADAAKDKIEKERCASCSGTEKVNYEAGEDLPICETCAGNKKAEISDEKIDEMINEAFDELGLTWRTQEESRNGLKCKFRKILENGGEK